MQFCREHACQGELKLVLEDQHILQPQIIIFEEPDIQ